MEAYRPMREIKIQRWNLCHMANEERQQRRATREECKREAMSRRAMAREDDRARKVRRTENAEQEYLQQTLKLVGKWTRLQEASKHKAARAATRIAEAKSREERRKRWRAMHRPDLTMAEILESRWF